MAFDKKNLLLYAVTDRRWLGERRLEDVVWESLDGGITMLQLREKDMDRGGLMREAFALRQMCRAYHIPFIVDDNVEVALESEADGVHIGQRDIPLKEARKLLGDDKIIGVSVQTVAEALKAEESGADYIRVGMIFPTGTRPEASVVPLETLRDITNAVKIPVAVMGGINPENFLKLSGYGISGACVISGIYGQPDIRAACAELLKSANTVVNG